MEVMNKTRVKPIQAHGRRFWPLLATALGDLVLIDLDPGTATNQHWHAKTEEFFYVISGQGRVETESKDQAVRSQAIQAGDAFVMPLGMAHKILADAPMTILKFDAPGFDPNDAHTGVPL